MKLHHPYLFAMLLVPSVLRAETVGEVLFDRQEVIVTSPTEMKYHVNRKVQVNSIGGTSLGVFEEYTDAFSSIADFSGKTESGGKVIKKIKKSDIYTQNFSESLADDTYINVYKPEATLFPYTVEYDYTIVYRKGIIAFPSFQPVIAFDIPVREGSYHISVPADIKIQFSSWSAPEVSDAGKTMEYHWTLTDFQPLKKEHNMPSPSKLLPYVKARPTDFTYLGTHGSQGDWKSVGLWLSEIMPTDSPLPDDLKAKVHDLTDAYPTDLEKLRSLYAYLKDKTRYVSIQFGLGGFSPSAPSVVHKKGYGDCKALSWFMKSILDEAGIESEYFTLNTAANLSKSYPGAGTMNHAMLMVPLQNDTVWVECTNPRLPLGYRHEDVAGKKALLVKEDGGELVTVPSYPLDTLVVRSSSSKVEFNPDGSAQVTVHEVFRLSEAEPYVSARDIRHDDLVGMLSKYCAVQNDDKKIISIADNFRDYSGVPGFIPEVDIDWSFFSRKYGSRNADMILLPVVLNNSRFTAQKSTRVHDLVFNTPYVEKNVMNVCIPEGYTVAFLPDPVSQETEFAECSMDYSMDGNVITISQTMKIKASKLPASAYDSYRSFTKSCTKAFQAKIVLKENANE